MKSNPKRKRPAKKIGVIGLGNMGRGIVKNLIKAGNDVFVWDINEETRASYARTANPNYSRWPHDLNEASDTGRVDGGFSRRFSERGWRLMLGVHPAARAAWIRGLGRRCSLPLRS